MIRSPLHRKTGLKRVSKKRKELLKDWEQTKAVVWARENGVCELCHAAGLHVSKTWLPNGERWFYCEGVLDWHHVRPRSQAPRLVCDPDNVVLIHRSFHSYIHEHPAWAKKEGWLK